MAELTRSTTEQMTHLDEVLRSYLDDLPTNFIRRKSFTSGFTITRSEEVLKWLVSAGGDGMYYQYLNTIPVGGLVVSPGTSPDASWRCVGDARAYLTVDAYGATPFTLYEGSVGVPSSSAAFQKMFDNMGYIKLGRKSRYVITTPVGLQGNYWRLFGNKGAVHKLTTETTGVTALQLVSSGGYADINKNCVFYTSETNVRYWKIDALSLVCHEAPIGDRPVGFLFPSVQQYTFEGIDTRGCLHSFWFKTGWQGTFRDVRTNQEIQDGWFFDDSRLNSAGVDTGTTAQSATSVVFDKCYANAPGRYGFHIRDADYVTFVNGACDTAGIAAYRFHKANITGNCSAESPVGTYFDITGGGAYNLYSSLYDALPDNGQYVMTVAGGALVNIVGNGRTGKNNRINVLGSGCSVRVDMTWYNGVNTGIGTNNCQNGSTMEVSIGRGAGASRYWIGTAAQELRLVTPYYTAVPTSLTSYAPKEARIGVTAATSVVTIPLFRIKEIFPNFNAANNNMVEWLRVTTTNLAGLAYGAIFFVTGNVVTGLKLDTQVSTGVGGSNAVISGITSDSNNLTITFTGTIGTNSVIKLQTI